MLIILRITLKLPLQNLLKTVIIDNVFLSTVYVPQHQFASLVGKFSSFEWELVSYIKKNLFVSHIR